MNNFNIFTCPLSVIEHGNIYQARSLKYQQLTSLNQWRSLFTQKGMHWLTTTSLLIA